MSEHKFHDGFAMVCVDCAKTFKATVLPAPRCRDCQVVVTQPLASLFGLIPRTAYVDEGATTPWAWAKLPGLLSGERRRFHHWLRSSRWRGGLLRAPWMSRSDRVWFGIARVGGHGLRRPEERR